VARRRFEQSTGPVSRLTLHGLDRDQRAALADLLGVGYLPEESPTVSVARLDAALLTSPAGLDTRGVVEAIGGPLADQAGERRQRRAAREQLWGWLERHDLVSAEPALRPWVETTRVAGVVGGSVPRTRVLLEEVLAVLAVLPDEGRSLAEVAADRCGDPHALDEGRRLPAYLLRALACRYGTTPPADAEQRRALWERAGVACDALSTTVLVAGLRPPGADPLAAMLRGWAADGQAAVLTLAQLRRHPIGAPAGRAVTGRTVWVVENPSVLAAVLARLGTGCPPLVCVAGWPNTAAVTLLRQLRQTGAALAYHGDLDADGVRIAAYVLARTGARPWRMSTSDYLAAVQPAGPPAGRRITEAPWDPDLAPAMRDRAVAVPEERVLNTLLADLLAAG